MVVVHRRSGPAAPRPSPKSSDAPPAGPEGLRLDRTRVLEVIPNTSFRRRRRPHPARHTRHGTGCGCTRLCTAPRGTAHPARPPSRPPTGPARPRCWVPEPRGRPAQWARRGKVRDVAGQGAGPARIWQCGEYRGERACECAAALWMRLPAHRSGRADRCGIGPARPAPSGADAARVAGTASPDRPGQLH